MGSFRAPQALKHMQCCVGVRSRPRPVAAGRRRRAQHYRLHYDLPARISGAPVTNSRRRQRSLCGAARPSQHLSRRLGSRGFANTRLTGAARADGGIHNRKISWPGNPQVYSALSHTHTPCSIALMVHCSVSARHPDLTQSAAQHTGFLSDPGTSVGVTRSAVDLMGAIWVYSVDSAQRCDEGTEHP